MFSFELKRLTGFMLSMSLACASGYAATDFSPIKQAKPLTMSNPAANNLAGYNFADTYNAVAAVDTNPYLNHNLLPASASGKYPNAWVVVHAPKIAGSYQPAQMDMLRNFNGAILSVVPDKSLNWGEISSLLPKVYTQQIPQSGGQGFRNVIHLQQSYSDFTKKAGPIILKRQLAGLKPGTMYRGTLTALVKGPGDVKVFSQAKDPTIDSKGHIVTDKTSLDAQTLEMGEWNNQIAYFDANDMDMSGWQLVHIPYIVKVPQGKTAVTLYITSTFNDQDVRTAEDFKGKINWTEGALSNFHALLLDNGVFQDKNVLINSSWSAAKNTSAGVTVSSAVSNISFAKLMSPKQQYWYTISVKPNPGATFYLYLKFDKKVQEFCKADVQLNVNGQKLCPILIVPGKAKNSTKNDTSPDKVPDLGQMGVIPITSHVIGAYARSVNGTSTITQQQITPYRSSTYGAITLENTSNDATYALNMEMIGGNDYYHTANKQGVLPVQHQLILKPHESRRIYAPSWLLNARLYLTGTMHYYDVKTKKWQDKSIGEITDSFGGEDSTLNLHDAIYKAALLPDMTEATKQLNKRYKSNLHQMAASFALNDFDMAFNAVFSTISGAYEIGETIGTPNFMKRWLRTDTSIDLSEDEIQGYLKNEEEASVLTDPEDQLQSTSGVGSNSRNSISNENNISNKNGNQNNSQQITTISGSKNSYNLTEDTNKLIQKAKSNIKNHKTNLSAYVQDEGFNDANSFTRHFQPASFRPAGVTVMAEGEYPYIFYKELENIKYGGSNAGRLYVFAMLKKYFQNFDRLKFKEFFIPIRAYLIDKDGVIATKFIVGSTG